MPAMGVGFLLGNMAEEEQLVARIVAVATVGVVAISQELAAMAIADMRGADQGSVAEETICMVTEATMRAILTGLQPWPALAEAPRPVLQEIPQLYTDYIVGEAVLLQRNPSLLKETEAVRMRLYRNQEFYRAHWTPGVGRVQTVVELWMGRISPPRMKDSPTERVSRLGCVDALKTHNQLMERFARNIGLQKDA